LALAQTEQAKQSNSAPEVLVPSWTELQADFQSHAAQYPAFYAQLPGTHLCGPRHYDDDWEGWKFFLGDTRAERLFNEAAEKAANNIGLSDTAGEKQPWRLWVDYLWEKKWGLLPAEVPNPDPHKALKRQGTWRDQVERHVRTYWHLSLVSAKCCKDLAEVAGEAPLVRPVEAAPALAQPPAADPSSLPIQAPVSLPLAKSQGTAPVLNESSAQPTLLPLTTSERVDASIAVLETEGGLGPSVESAAAPEIAGQPSQGLAAVPATAMHIVTLESAQGEGTVERPQESDSAPAHQNQSGVAEVPDTGATAAPEPSVAPEDIPEHLRILNAAVAAMELKGISIPKLAELVRHKAKKLEPEAKVDVTTIRYIIEGRSKSPRPFISKPLCDVLELCDIDRALVMTGFSRKHGKVS
jgi:hypothetical protein